MGEYCVDRVNICLDHIEVERCYSNRSRVFDCLSIKMNQIFKI